MIAAVCRQLEADGQKSCVQNTLFFQEKGKGVKLTTKGNAIKIKVDGCLISDTKKCDCLYFYEHSKNQRYAFLVELKGTHYDDALEQLAATYQHPNCKALINATQVSKKTFAVAIVGARAKTNRPSKDEWENQNKLRLRVIPLDNDETYDLTNLVKEN